MQQASPLNQFQPGMNIYQNDLKDTLDI